MDSLHRKADNFKKNSNKEYLKINKFASPEEIINRSYAYLKTNNNFQKEEIPDTYSHYNFEHKNQFDNKAFSPARSNTNLNNSNYMDKNRVNTQTLRKDLYSNNSNHNLISKFKFKKRK